MTQTKLDGWASVLSGLNTFERDKRTRAHVVAATRLGRADLSALYESDDVCATIVDLPAEEMTRQGFSVICDDDAQELITDAIDGLNVDAVLTEAIKWSRLYGGALVLLGADDGQDPQYPLDLKRVKSLRFLTVIDRYWARPHVYYDDPLAANFGKPRVYAIQAPSMGNAAPVSYVHESRVLRFDGTVLPAGAATANYGWGDSVLTRVNDLVRDYGLTFSAVAYLVSDFSQLILRIKGLREALASPDGAQIIRARMEAIEMGRSVMRGVLLDEGEEYDRKNVSFAGVPEVLEKFILRLSQATRIPVSLLMGQSPAGLNATGDADIRYFYDRIKSLQMRMLRPQLNKLLAVLFAAKDGPTRGQEPDSWSVKFAPLWQMSQAERAELYLKTAQADAIYITNNVLDPSEVAVAAFAGDEFSLERKVDFSARDALNVPPQPQPNKDPEVVG